MQALQDGRNDRESPMVAIHGPDGELVHARQTIASPPRPTYEPPSRQRVAEVVAKCEKDLINEDLNGESEVGVILREASKQLYWDDTIDQTKTIFPHALLVEVFTKERIERSLSSDPAACGGYSIDECVRRIRGNGEPDLLGRFARIFATLLLCNRDTALFQFFEKDLDDSAFPFQLGPSYGRGRGSINTRSMPESDPNFPERWSSRHCEVFIDVQWRVFLPCFEEGYHKFQSAIMMPWYDYHLRATGSSSSTLNSVDGSMNAPGGGHSDVSRVVIHDGHHKFVGLRQAPGSPASFAIKRLKATDEDTFKKEVAMLSRLGGKKPHTVKLLATFCHGGTYSLLFQWAECDLLEYWDRPPGGHEKNAALVRWVCAQCLGLTGALDWIHNPSGDVLDAENKELFGRHGDIKAENILFYKASPDATDPLALGELVITDFGLSSLNHKNTCTNIANGDILHTTAYAPPESVLPGQFISRAIDIWALGCVYLEFVTWLIGGRGFLVKFKTARLAPFLGDTVNNDIFWEVQNVAGTGSENPGHVTVVKPQVVKWINFLRREPRATRYIQEFLDIIECDMLVINKNERSTASQLTHKFKGLDMKCREVPSYCTAPTASNTLLSQPAQQSTQIPVMEHLSQKVELLLARSPTPLRQYSGQAKPILPGSGSTHLRP